MTDLSSRKREIPSDFDDVAPTYDFLTGMNPGYHRHLRQSAARLPLPPEPRILDLCCGTGLSTEALLAVHPRARVIGLDASRGMLDEARKKPVLRNVELLHGDAMDPRAAGLTGEVDGILMAYGIRNVPDMDLCLERLFELLTPGGTICFHEYSVKDSRRARATWDAVCWGIIVPGGLVTAGSARIYRYLHKSVRAFDGVRAFEKRLSRIGYTNVRTEPMDGWQRGILHSFLAERPLPIGVAE
jgi:ubiquinone/menaquinone biosynthesis C-methylase UbiE